METIKFSKEGHIYTQGDTVLPSVTQIIDHFGLSDFSFADESILERARNLGTNVHLACQLSDEDDLGQCPEPLYDYVKSWQKFRADYPLEWMAVEKPMASLIWQFAGTQDRVSSEHIIDIKTGGKYKSHQIQTAAYQILAEETLGIKIKNRWVVYLTDAGYTLEIHKDRNDRQIFLSMMSVYNWKKEKGLINGK